MAVSLTFAAGQGEGRVVVRLYAREAARKCAVRTKSFDVAYRVEGEAAGGEAAALLRALVTQLDTRDPGGLRVP